MNWLEGLNTDQVRQHLSWSLARVKRERHVSPGNSMPGESSRPSGEEASSAQRGRASPLWHKASRRNADDTGGGTQGIFVKYYELMPGF